MTNYQQRCVMCNKASNTQLKDFTKEPFSYNEKEVPICSYECATKANYEIIEDIRKDNKEVPNNYEYLYD